MLAGGPPGVGVWGPLALCMPWIEAMVKPWDVLSMPWLGEGFLFYGRNLEPLQLTDRGKGC